MAKAGNLNSRYDIPESLVANSLWVVWLLRAVSMVGPDPKVSSA